MYADFSIGRRPDTDCPRCVRVSGVYPKGREPAAYCRATPRQRRRGASGRNPRGPRAALPYSISAPRRRVARVQQIASWAVSGTGIYLAVIARRGPSLPWRQSPRAPLRTDTRNRNRTVTSLDAAAPGYSRSLLARVASRRAQPPLRAEMMGKLSARAVLAPNGLGDVGRRRALQRETSCLERDGTLAPPHPRMRTTQSTPPTVRRLRSQRSEVVRPKPYDHRHHHRLESDMRASGVYLYVQVRVHDVVQRLLVARMLAQVPVADRVFLLRRHRRCFVGSDAVAWLVSRRFARTVAEAEALGNALLRAGVFRHVQNEHPFRAGNYFYRFAAHENYAVDDENFAGLRSSRLMSVATRRYTRGTTSSDDTTFASSIDDIAIPVESELDDENLMEMKPFTERDVKVEIGIRIGVRMYSDLVSRFATLSGLSKGQRSSSGRLVKDSFTGAHAALWLERQGYVRSCRDAVAVGNAMIKAGVFFPVEAEAEGFEANDTLYRMTADVDFAKELRRGQIKDRIFQLVGINRAKGVENLAAQNAPWFEDSLSFTTASSTGY